MQMEKEKEKQREREERQEAADSTGGCRLLYRAKTIGSADGDGQRVRAPGQTVRLDTDGVTMRRGDLISTCCPPMISSGMKYIAGFAHLGKNKRRWCVGETSPASFDRPGTFAHT